jgi:hypothetical protein
MSLGESYKQLKMKILVLVFVQYIYNRVQNGSGAHPASYPMGTRGSFPRGKAVGPWSWPFTFM